MYTSGSSPSSSASSSSSSSCSSSSSASSSSSSSSCRAWSSSCSSHMFGPKYPSYDSLGPSLGLSWAHVRPMPMLASVRTMLTHVAPRSGLG